MPTIEIDVPDEVYENFTEYVMDSQETKEEAAAWLFARGLDMETQ